jgi:hypothetical protein
VAAASGRRPPSSAAAESGLVADESGLDATPGAELGKHRCHVVLHGLLGEKQTLTDLGVGEPLRDEIEDFPFAFGQLVERVGVLVGPPIERREGKAGIPVMMLVIAPFIGCLR